MKKYKKIAAILCIGLEIVALSACSRNSERSINRTDDETAVKTEETEAVTENVTAPTETAKHEMETAWDISYISEQFTETKDTSYRIWSEKERHGYGQLYYPGFEMITMKYANGQRLTQSLRAGNINIIKVSDSALVITNGYKTTQLNAQISLFDNTLFSGKYSADVGERVFFHDLTEDGSRELIIKMTFMDMGYRYNEVYVYNTDTLKLLKIPTSDDFGQYLNDFMTDSYTQNVSETGLVSYKIEDGDSNVVIGEYMPEEGAVNVEAVTMDSSFIYVSDGKLYYKNEIQLTDADNRSAVPVYLHKICDIVIELNYDEEEQCFKVDRKNISIVKNGTWNKEDYLVLDKDAAKKAAEEYDAWLSEDA